jgi:hypothetical protein
MVVQLSEETGKRWSLVFIDGDHEGDAPRLDAEVVHRYAGEDAAILLHDLTSPYVATALAWLRDHGWTTAIYQTMQIMGIAVRGVVKPVAHLPDPRQRWTLPRHLASFPVIGETRGLRLRRIVTDIVNDCFRPAGALPRGGSRWRGPPRRGAPFSVGLSGRRLSDRSSPPLAASTAAQPRRFSVTSRPRQKPAAKPLTALAPVWRVRTSPALASIFLPELQDFGPAGSRRARDLPRSV